MTFVHQHRRFQRSELHLIHHTFPNWRTDLCGIPTDTSSEMYCRHYVHDLFSELRNGNFNELLLQDLSDNHGLNNVLLPTRLSGARTSPFGDCPPYAAILEVADVISAVLPSDAGLGNTTLRVTDLISAGFMPRKADLLYNTCGTGTSTVCSLMVWRSCGIHSTTSSIYSLIIDTGKSNFRSATRSWMCS